MFSKDMLQQSLPHSKALPAPILLSHPLLHLICLSATSRVSYNRLKQIIPKLQKQRIMDESDDQSSVLSPAAFITGLDHPNPEPRTKEHQLPKPRSQNQRRISLNDGTNESQKSERKRLAGLKSREKKRKELSVLEESVNDLTLQIEQCEAEISKCKNQLVQAIKLSTHSSSEHAHTFSELERLIASEDADLDDINLLLDIIQSRIGATGKERQSKLDYNFKQIINSLFPALHRYLMYAAGFGKDIFQEGAEKMNQQELCASTQKWTKVLYQPLNFTPDQIKQFNQKKQTFIDKRQETISLIAKLKRIRLALKSQQQTIQNVLSHIRLQMNPIQSSRIILFGQKNKLRQEFLFLDAIFAWEQPPSKRTKLQ